MPAGLSRQLPRQLAAMPNSLSSLFGVNSSSPESNHVNHVNRMTKQGLSVLDDLLHFYSLLQ